MERKRKHAYGINEKGKYSGLKYKNIYTKWHNMVKRVFDPAIHDKYPTYLGCTISDEFLNYQKFASWLVLQKGYENNWDLDKDVLFKGNKHYSSETCVLIPFQINKMLTKTNSKRGIAPIGVRWHKRDSIYEVRVCVGDKVSKYVGRFKDVNDAFIAYKEAKEEVIKSQAEKYKEYLDPRAYEALMKYEVEITD